MTLRFDHMWRLVRPSRHRVLLWVTLLLPAAVVLEAGGAMMGASFAGKLLCPAAALLAALSTGALAGHALAVSTRLSRTPHVPLRR
jgi:hypothetical protein